MRVLTVTILLSLFTDFSFAQDCLSNARDLFDNGHLKAIESVFIDCIDSLSKQQKAEAYEILARASLELNENEKAEEYMLARLRVLPEVKPSNTSDPAFRKLYQSFRTTPVMSIGIELGYNYCNPKGKIAPTTFMNGARTTLTGHNLGSIIFGVRNKYLLNSKVELFSGLAFRRFRFNKTQVEINGGSQQIEINELQERIRIPLGISLKSSETRIFSTRFIINAAIEGEFLLKSDIINAELDLGRSVNIRSYRLNNYDIIEFKNRWLLNGVLGIGLQKTYYNKYILEVNLNYHKSLNSINNNEIYVLNGPLAEVGYTNDPLKLDYWSFGLIGSVFIFNPKKLK